MQEQNIRGRKLKECLEGKTKLNSLFRAGGRTAMVLGLAGVLTFSPTPSPSSGYSEVIDRLTIPDCGGNPIAAVATTNNNSLNCDVIRYNKIVYEGNAVSCTYLRSMAASLDAEEIVEFQVFPYLKYVIRISNSDGPNSVNSSVEGFGLSNIEEAKDATDELAEYIAESLGEERSTIDNYIKGIRNENYSDPYWLGEDTCLVVMGFIDRESNEYLSIDSNPQGSIVTIDMLVGRADYYTLPVGKLEEYLQALSLFD